MCLNGENLKCLRARQHGGVIFHILLATYMFLGKHFSSFQIVFKYLLARKIEKKYELKKKFICLACVTMGSLT